MSDPLIGRLIQKIVHRSNAGLKRYGVTMERKDKTTLEWLKDAQEEMLDAAVYLQRVIEDLEKTRKNNVTLLRSVGGKDVSKNRKVPDEEKDTIV